MRTCRVVVVLAMTAAVCVSAQAQQPPKKRKLLCIAQCKGFQHDSASHAMATLWKLGQESGLWDTFIRTDTQLLTKKKPNAGYNGLGHNFDVIDRPDLRELMLEGVKWTMGLTEGETTPRARPRE